jgi:hypothetical protein
MIKKFLIFIFFSQLHFTKTQNFYAYQEYKIKSSDPEYKNACKKYKINFSDKEYTINGFFITNTPFINNIIAFFNIMFVIIFMTMRYCFDSKKPLTNSKTILITFSLLLWTLTPILRLLNFNFYQKKLNKNNQYIVNIFLQPNYLWIIGLLFEVFMFAIHFQINFNPISFVERIPFLLQCIAYIIFLILRKISIINQLTERLNKDLKFIEDEPKIKILNAVLEQDLAWEYYEKLPNIITKDNITYIFNK